MISPLKNKTYRQAFCVFWLILFFFAQSFAWNKPGHMTPGAIAAKELKRNDPATFAIVVALLKKQPSN